VLICAAILIACVLTARSKLGVVLGIVMILASRLVIAGALQLLRYTVGSHR
jgi:hypothetical protein